jgi:large subunit ribosomal protein L9
MKVILLKDIKGTGKKGDILNASDGHARNYLLPRGLAKLATDSSVKELKHQQDSADKRLQEEIDEAQALADKISEIEIKIISKAGKGGKLFGSITNKDIAELLEKDHGIKIEKKKISMDTIKVLGSVYAEVKVYTGIVGKMKVMVVEPE